METNVRNGFEEYMDIVRFIVTRGYSIAPFTENFFMPWLNDCEEQAWGNIQRTRLLKGILNQMITDNILVPPRHSADPKVKLLYSFHATCKVQDYETTVAHSLLLSALYGDYNKPPPGTVDAILKVEHYLEWASNESCTEYRRVNFEEREVSCNHTLNATRLGSKRPRSTSNACSGSWSSSDSEPSSPVPLSNSVLRSSSTSADPSIVMGASQKRIRTPSPFDVPVMSEKETIESFSTLKPSVPLGSPIVEAALQKGDQGLIATQRASYNPVQLEPPPKLIASLARLSSKHPDAIFEFIFKSNEWQIKCADCPERTYKTKLVSNLDLHLHSATHRAAASERLSNSSIICPFTDGLSSQLLQHHPNSTAHTDQENDTGHDPVIIEPAFKINPERGSTQSQITAAMRSSETTDCRAYKNPLPHDTLHEGSQAQIQPAILEPNFAKLDKLLPHSSNINLRPDQLPVGESSKRIRLDEETANFLEITQQSKDMETRLSNLEATCRYQGMHVERLSQLAIELEKSRKNVGQSAETFHQLSRLNDKHVEQLTEEIRRSREMIDKMEVHDIPSRLRSLEDAHQILKDDIRLTYERENILTKTVEEMVPRIQSAETLVRSQTDAFSRLQPQSVSDMNEIRSHRQAFGAFRSVTEKRLKTLDLQSKEQLKQITEHIVALKNNDAQTKESFKYMMGRITGLEAGENQHNAQDQPKTTDLRRKEQPKHTIEQISTLQKCDTTTKESFKNMMGRITSLEAEAGQGTAQFKYLIGRNQELETKASNRDRQFKEMMDRILALERNKERQDAKIVELKEEVELQKAQSDFQNTRRKSVRESTLPSA